MRGTGGRGLSGVREGQGDRCRQGRTEGTGRWDGGIGEWDRVCWTASHVRTG